MGKAATDRDNLIAAQGLEDILSAVVAAFDENVEAITDTLFSDPGFDFRLETALNDEIGSLELHYVGDLPEGEATEPELSRIEILDDYSVVALNDRKISLILSMTAEINMHVSFDDQSDAWYDKEDGVWVGTVPRRSMFMTSIRVRIFVTLDRSSGEFLEAELLTREASVQEWRDMDIYN
jgi:hypothetical protein